MKTIYLVQKRSRYGGEMKLLRAYESRTDAEELVEILKVLEAEGIEITELHYQLTRIYSHEPAPRPPAYRGIGEGWVSAIRPDFREGAVAAAEPDHA